MTSTPVVTVVFPSLPTVTGETDILKFCASAKYAVISVSSLISSASYVRDVLFVTPSSARTVSGTPSSPVTVQ